MSVVERYRALEPRLRDKPIHVVPHGLDEGLLAALVRHRTPVGADVSASEGPLKIMVLGQPPEKGGAILAAACGRIAKFAQIWLLGTGESGDAFRFLPGVTVVAHYDSGELGNLLREVGPTWACSCRRCPNPSAIPSANCGLPASL
ncbi:MAG: hypothetical protein U5K56_07020 [Halioglobus sp.]|nr:hypothetical protein [Halioglobus sp.]